MISVRLLQGHIDRALVYVSHCGLLIRPLKAPTSTHAAFENPKQPLYMSATLGEAGELERGFGRTRIDRIPVPAGWDKQGTGGGSSPSRRTSPTWPPHGKLSSGGWPT